MFCKIRKGKEFYSIYICERYRKDGKVVSKDKKIVRFGWHSLYEDDEEYTGLKEKLPSTLYRFLNKLTRGYSIDVWDDVERKLIETKKEYYPIYKEMAIKWNAEYEEKKAIEEKENLLEYEKFKNKYKILHHQELSAKYQEGYLNGQLSSMNFSSVNNLDIDNQEKTLLKEAFKLLSRKHHPDVGGDTDTMAKINNLKEKIL